MTFRTTRWSLVASAARDGAAGDDALAQLCAIYWPAVYAFYQRATGDAHRAEDLTQGLFAQLLAKDSFAAADPARGRFRNWLLACARHYQANVAAAANAVRRGGGAGPISLDTATEEERLRLDPVDPGAGPEQAFARGWVRALVDRVLAELALEFERRGRSRVFAAARPFLDPACDPGPMRDAAARIGATETAFKVAVHRMRERFHELVRAEIAHTLGDERDLEDELAHLHALLARR